MESLNLTSRSPTFIGEADVLLVGVWNTGDLPFPEPLFLYEKVGVVPTQVVKDDLHVFGELKVKIALVVCGAAIPSREMIVIPYLILSQCATANVEECARRKVLLIFVRHRHGFVVPIDFVNLPNFLLHALRKFLGRILPTVDDRFLVVVLGILHTVADTRWSM